ncbi:hypothetical protein [Paracidobacterium acidisoli]|uniref:Uncharacterized protein n=1 Tax=Paracidobacterium acidisoli TaxID=2303751 RepID=A0A372IR52_9BACT|nr:hypothetical protein [Paracidobacterium acidisoli]
MVLSPRSLSYSRYALESLFRNSAEPLHLHLVTDSPSDKALLEEELTLRQQTCGHAWSIYDETELKDAEAAIFGRFPHLRQFRRGHPCWRKITDPLLLSSPGEEMVLLDPDLYFPNHFRFEPTPEHGLLLMWQKPNCLFPPETVRAAMTAGIPLAHHVDIGVAHWRATADLEWLDWLVEKLNFSRFPQIMHIEAIVWSALAIHIGGGYLDPRRWHCWYRSQYSRLLSRFGVNGVRSLRNEPFTSIKCFHAGGRAKSWLADAKAAGILDGNSSLTEPGSILPFVELTPRAYRRQQNIKHLLARLGYYAVFQSI